jgi:hypothetical protein
MHQEHGLEQVARAHTPCMGAWMPCSALGICPVHVRLAPGMHPSALVDSSCHA